MVLCIQLELDPTSCFAIGTIWNGYYVHTRL